MATREITGLIVDAITNQPRSLQRTIGPSELGNPCDHCLAARLAGWTKHEKQTPWLTVIGTAMHAWLENQFENINKTYKQAHGTDRYLTERRVKVGMIGGTEIWGSTDLVDLQARMTVDWKIVGDRSLRKYAHGPSPTYRAQAHLYAKGWNDTGTPIEHVSIYFLPRNRPMDAGHWWHEPYDPALAQTTLDRAAWLARNLEALAPIPKARDAWISNLPREPGCWDCSKYDDRPPATGKPGATPGRPPSGLGLFEALDHLAYGQTPPQNQQAAPVLEPATDGGLFAPLPGPAQRPGLI